MFAELFPEHVEGAENEADLVDLHRALVDPENQGEVTLRSATLEDLQNEIGLCD